MEGKSPMKKKTRPTRSRVVYGDQFTPSSLGQWLRPPNIQTVVSAMSTGAKRSGASPLLRLTPSATELGPMPREKIKRNRPTVAASHPQCSRRRCPRSHPQQACYRCSGARTASMERVAENEVMRRGNSYIIPMPLWGGWCEADIEAGSPRALRAPPPRGQDARSIRHRIAAGR